MNILFSVQSYKPLMDGVQMVTSYHAEGLVRLGHKVTVITSKADNLSDEEEINGVKVLRCSLYIRHTFYRGEKKEYICRFKELADEADVVVNVCTQTPFTDLLLPVLDDVRCKKILYLHSMTEFKWNKYDWETAAGIAHKVWNGVRWGIFYNRAGKYIKKYDRVIQIHQTDQAVSFYKRKYGIESRIIMNAADDIFFGNRHSRGGKEKPYFIMVANYMQLKNQEFVLKAYYRSKFGSSHSLLFIGSKETKYYNNLILQNKELAEKYGKRDVKFLTGIPRKKIPEYVGDAKIYLFGSKVEKFPVAIVEAMACGVPYISTDVGCVKFLPGGIVINNEEDMAYWIDLLCENEKIRLCLGDIGRNYAEENLRIEQKVTQLERIIQEIL